MENIPHMCTYACSQTLFCFLFLFLFLIMTSIFVYKTDSVCGKKKEIEKEEHTNQSNEFCEQVFVCLRINNSNKWNELNAINSRTAIGTKSSHKFHLQIYRFVCGYCKIFHFIHLKRRSCPFFCWYANWESSIAKGATLSQRSKLQMQRHQTMVDWSPPKNMVAFSVQRIFVTLFFVVFSLQIIHEIYTINISVHLFWNCLSFHIDDWVRYKVQSKWEKYPMDFWLFELYRLVYT